MRFYKLTRLIGVDFDSEVDEEEEEEDEEDAHEEKVEPEKVKIEQDYQNMLANRNQKRKKKEARESDKNEPLYCFCQQVSYGEMVACDGDHCPYEWFHMECVGLDEPPKGAWYCDHCAAEIRNKRKNTTAGSSSITKKMKKRNA